MLIQLSFEGPIIQGQIIIQQPLTMYMERLKNPTSPKQMSHVEAAADLHISALQIITGVFHFTNMN